ncbi:sugar 3,4-ketoisomerase [Hymenobacter tenuis]
MNRPHLIEFPKIGEPDVGFISVVEEQKAVPFAVQRVFWTYHTPESIVRGRHAHHHTHQVLVAVAGRIIVMTETVSGELATFRLEDPSTGIYIPPYVWHTMQYSSNAVQLVLASRPYEEADYIRQYEEFRKMTPPLT